MMHATSACGCRWPTGLSAWPLGGRSKASKNKPTAAGGVIWRAAVRRAAIATVRRMARGEDVNGAHGPTLSTGGHWTPTVGSVGNCRDCQDRRIPVHRDSLFVSCPQPGCLAVVHRLGRVINGTRIARHWRSSPKSAHMRVLGSGDCSCFFSTASSALHQRTDGDKTRINRKRVTRSRGWALALTTSRGALLLVDMERRQRTSTSVDDSAAQAAGPRLYTMVGPRQAGQDIVLSRLPGII